MINVLPVWKQGIQGAGVRVRINDNGIDSSHVEFAGRFDSASSCPNSSPDPNSEQVGHGTAVAGIVGAAAGNGECSVGIAPKVTLSACNIYSYPDYLEHTLNSYDISQNSFGIDGCAVRSSGQRILEPMRCPFQFVPTGTAFPCDYCDNFSKPSDLCVQSIAEHCSYHFREDQTGCLDFLTLVLGGNCLYQTLSNSRRETLTKGILEGREGKGIIYVFASGNAFGQGDDTNAQAFANSRLVISVGAVAKDRTHSTYSTPGASLFVVGPGGDSDSVSNHITTGVGGICTSAGRGTSFSCPVVSGVIALVLEVNPNLTWRDVQYILAKTSQRVDDPQDTTAFQNAAGYWHSNWYGFGIVDAAAAVETARKWILVAEEQIVVAETGLLNLPIVDDESVFLDTSVAVTAPANFAAEAVEVQLAIDSFARGHLEIILTSPQGTQSILHPGRRPENTQVEDRWKLLTVRNWGEDPNGEWTLTIVDLKKGDAGDCASQTWSTDIGNQRVDCNYLEFMGYCQNGQVDPFGLVNPSVYDYIFAYQDEGVLAQQACCACGGGLTADKVSDLLKQWTLVIYGRDRLESTPSRAPGSPPTSKAPTTKAPNSVASSPQGPTPTKKPTRNPSFSSQPAQANEPSTTTTKVRLFCDSSDSVILANVLHLNLTPFSFFWLQCCWQL